MNPIRIRGSETCFICHHLVLVSLLVIYFFLFNWQAKRTQFISSPSCWTDSSSSSLCTFILTIKVSRTTEFKASLPKEIRNLLVSDSGRAKEVGRGEIYALLSAVDYADLGGRNGKATRRFRVQQFNNGKSTNNETWQRFREDALRVCDTDNEIIFDRQQCANNDSVMISYKLHLFGEISSSGGFNWRMLCGFVIHNPHCITELLLASNRCGHHHM